MSRIRKIPHIIAICGLPGSGKSEVQKRLSSKGIIPIDDGAPLREFAINNLGLTVADVYTQDGKLRTTRLLNKEWQHRQLLGDLGVQLEAMLGENIMPFMATRKLWTHQSYSFGSVRRRQAEFYKSLGGFVLGVRRPDVEPSPYEFDQFDESLIDMWIENDSTINDLYTSVDILLDSLPSTGIKIRWTL